MRKRSLERAWTAALALIAAIALAMALYVQSVERRARQETDRTLATRSGANLEETAETPSAEPAPEQPGEPGEPGDQPLPNTVLRRGESGSRLQQALDSRDAQLARLREDFAALERASERSDRALRRDLEELRTAVRREQEASAKVQNLLLVALVPLLLHLLTSVWRRGGGDGPR
jgi:hypothetical protein